VKSREDRKREARCGGIWVLAVVTGLLLVYVLLTGTPTWIGAIAPLIAATAALCGVYFGAHLSQQQRLKDEQRRRRALATLLLSEIQVLYEILQDIYTSLPFEGTS
jgi:dolichol kinase